MLKGLWVSCSTCIAMHLCISGEMSLKLQGKIHSYWRWNHKHKCRIRTRAIRHVRSINDNRKSIYDKFLQAVINMASAKVLYL